MKRIIVVIILVLTSFQTGYTQEVVTADDIKMLFEDQAKVWWVRHYKGLINDMHDITMILGFDGEVYHGYATYLRSKTRFQLYGKAGTALKLYEIDETGKISGIIKGSVSPQMLKASWQNYQNTVGLSMLLTEAKPDDNKLTGCGDNKWVKNYEGTYFGKTTKLLLQQYAEGHYKGIFYVTHENKTYTVEGIRQSGEDKVYLHLINENNEKKGRLDCKNIGADRVDYTLRNDEGIFASNFKNTRTVQTEAIEFIDYLTLMDVTYPSLKSNDDFNAMIYQQYDKWLKKNRSQTEKEQRKISKQPKNRARLRAYGWYEVEYLSQHYISMRLSYVDNWSGYEEVTWTYDLRHKETLKADDLFLQNSGYAEFVKTYITQALKKHPDYQDPDYSKWVAKENFKYFTLRHEGINFSTKYNPIYGARQVTVPYEVLRPYLKKIIY